MSRRAREIVARDEGHEGGESVVKDTASHLETEDAHGELGGRLETFRVSVALARVTPVEVLQEAARLRGLALTRMWLHCDECGSVLDEDHLLEGFGPFGRALCEHCF